MPPQIVSWTCKSKTLANRISNCIRLSKLSNSCTKESGSPGTKFNRNFLISWRNLTQWGPLLPKGGGMIQVDIGGHQPIPLGPPPLSLSVFQFRHNLLFLAGFQVLHSRRRFGGLMIQVDIGGHPPIPFGPPPLVLQFFSFSTTYYF